MKLGVPLVIGCVMIASLVVVQATAITAILGLVRRQVPRGDTLAQWCTASACSRARCC